MSDAAGAVKHATLLTKPRSIPSQNLHIGLQSSHTRRFHDVARFPG